MSSNVRQPNANVMEVGFSTASSIAAGGGVLVGNLFGVAELDIPATTAVPTPGAQLRVRGAVQIAKAGSLAVAIGDALYWDDSGKVVNKTATNKEVGIAYSSTSNGAGETSVNMLLVQTLRNATGS
jgi:predicted RecA/RadA family phage recombinase